MTNPVPTRGRSFAQPVFLDGNRTADDKIRVCATPHGYDVAEGHITGHKLFYKSGLNVDINNVEEDLWPVGGVYLFPVATSSVWVHSSHAQDAASGQGIRSVSIYYLDADMAERAATVTLMGTTPIQTTENNIYRINAFRTKTSGEGRAASGDIDVAATGMGIIYSRISTGKTSGRNSVYTVPLGKTLYIDYVMFGVGNATGGRYARFSLKAKYQDLEDRATSEFFTYFEVGVQDGAITTHIPVPLKFVAGTDIKISAISDNVAAAAIYTGSYRGWLEDD